MPSTLASAAGREQLHDGSEHAVIVCLVSGRSLKFGPDWSCSATAVLFDRHSGDYWVVSSLATELIRLLQGGVALSSEELERQLQSMLPELDLSEDLLPTLQSLSDNGLVLLKS